MKGGKIMDLSKLSHLWLAAYHRESLMKVTPEQRLGWKIIFSNSVYTIERDLYGRIWVTREGLTAASDEEYMFQVRSCKECGSPFFLCGKYCSDCRYLLKQLRKKSK
jgi:hypothetical protein